MNLKQYKQKLAGLRTSVTRMRDNVQELIRVGMNHYIEHGDTAYLTLLAETCVGVKALPTHTIAEYIKAHANVKWTKPKGEVGRFVKDGKGPAIVHDLNVTWFEWSVGNHNNIKDDVDADHVVRLALRRIEKALKDGKVKNPEHAAGVVAKMKAITGTTEAA